MNLWKRISLKNWCCEVCNNGTKNQHKKIHGRSLKKRARAMMKRFWKKDLD